MKRFFATVVCAVLLWTGCAHAKEQDQAQRGTPSARPAPMPTLQTRVVARGLEIPWDAVPLSATQALVSERDRFRLSIVDLTSGAQRVVAATVPNAWHNGETGLMSIALDPAFHKTGRFYTCQGMTLGRVDQVGVMAWTLDRARTTATPGQVLISGIQATNGRHGGCRLLVLRARKGAQMYVGTGDAAVGTTPQDMASLNGKVLRLNARTGAPWRGNPWIRSSNPNERYVFSIGHRNVQGLAVRKGGQIWSVEHGTGRDDEINLIRRGGNYGWNPVPGYDESRPMTDQGLPGRQIEAKWSSGDPTVATSGATFVKGKAWGVLNGTMAVAELKGSALRFLKFNKRGRLVQQWLPPAMKEFGRLRSVHQLPGGDLLVTTSNGRDDALVVIHPTR